MFSFQMMVGWTGPAALNWEARQVLVVTGRSPGRTSRRRGLDAGVWLVFQPCQKLEWKSSTPGGIRTHNLRLRRPTRYPIVPRAQEQERPIQIVTRRDRERQEAVVAGVSGFATLARLAAGRDFRGLFAMASCSPLCSPVARGEQPPRGFLLWPPAHTGQWNRHPDQPHRDAAEQCKNWTSAGSMTSYRACLGIDFSW